MTYSRWAEIEEIVNNTTQISYDSNIKKSGIETMYDDNHLYINDKEGHNLVVGSTGSGKTQATLLPQIRLAIKANESFVVNDVQGEIYERISGELQKQNYKLYVLDLEDGKRGNNYNPFSVPYKLYKNNERDKALDMIENIAYYFLATDKMNPNVDPFWENSAISLFVGLTIYLFEHAKEEEININSITYLVNYLDDLTEELKQADKNSLLYTNLASIVLAPTETKGSIISVFSQKIKQFTNRESITKVLSATNIDIENIQREKTAIFLINSNKASSRSIVPLIIDQAANIALMNTNVERRLNIYIDDFETLKAIKDFNNLLTISRSHNIRFNIYIKSLLELDNTYGKEESDLLKMSFANIIYLLANDQETLEQISKLCGRKDENTPLITIEELKRLDYFEAIILSPRMYPIKTKLLPDYKIDWNFDNTIVPIRELEFTEIKVYNK